MTDPSRASSFDVRAASERIRFKLGPLEGRVRVEYDAATDNCTVTATLRTLERDTGEPATVNTALPCRRPSSFEELLDLATLVFRNLWDHEFDEGFMVDGVRHRDPHRGERP